MNMRPSTTSKTAPRDARELVGKHDRQHIVMPPLLATSIQGLSPWPFHLFGFTFTSATHAASMERHASG